MNIVKLFIPPRPVTTRKKMKPYGVPRNKDVEAPDVADIQRYGLNEKRLDGKKDYHRTGKTRTARRRVWKKKARRDGRKETYVE